MRARCVGILALACWLAAPAGAEGDRPERRVGFSVERSREVANDQVTAVLSVTHEDPSAAEVAARINRDMAWALGLAKAKSGVRAESGGYSTQPWNDPKRGSLRHWRGVQQLVLESGDVGAVTALVGELQAKLQLESLGFSVSPERRREVEAELVAEVIAAFRARAALVQQSFGAAGHRLVEVQISTGGGMPVPVARMRMMAAEADAMAGPAVEGGTSRIDVAAHGSIELER